MVVAGLDSIRQDFKLNSNIPLDSSLERNIMESMHEVRAVLCYFNVSIKKHIYYITTTYFVRLCSNVCVKLLC